MAIFLISGIILLIALLLALYAWQVLVKPPKNNKTELQKINFQVNTPSFSKIKNNWLKHNQNGLWEMYVEGKAFERGFFTGKLTQDQMFRQEKYFIEAIRKMVPGRIYIAVLKYLVAWMNRNLNRKVGDEYNSEIYGISLSAPKKFSRIGPRYIRMLNYHAAHDIGHTLEYMNFVGCTAFSVKGPHTADGNIIHGRNFDFHVGDEFSRDKIISFVKPEQGHCFAMITWGGMIGTVTGMNIHGLAVSVNGAKSKLPMRTDVPISILIRKILQYASNIDEACAIAQNHRIFVSEALLISSGKENRNMIIEKTPFQTICLDTGDKTICSNHFQSSELSSDPMNLQQIAESSSMYRFERMQQLLGRHRLVGPHEAAAILRDRNGIDDKNIGMGNEKAIDQLVAHHSVIFQPASLNLWISSGPYTLGKYFCYNLEEVFKSVGQVNENSILHQENMIIDADPFLENGGYHQFISFREKAEKLQNTRSALPDTIAIDEMIALNPEYFIAYQAAGDHCMNCKDYAQAGRYYKTALTKTIPIRREYKALEKKLHKTNLKSGNIL